MFQCKIKSVKFTCQSPAASVWLYYIYTIWSPNSNPNHTFSVISSSIIYNLYDIDELDFFSTLQIQQSCGRLQPPSWFRHPPLRRWNWGKDISPLFRPHRKYLIQKYIHSLISYFYGGTTEAFPGLEHLLNQGDSGVCSCTTLDFVLRNCSWKQTEHVEHWLVDQ